MEMWTAFILGFLGSLHCAGMCGPLVLALSATGSSKASCLLGRVVNNLGRITTYGFLGMIFSLLGRTLAVAGLQRWVSLIAGVAVIIAWVASSRYAVTTPLLRAVGWLKAGQANLLQQRTFKSLFFLGVLNGFLPCGLVYAACAGAVAAGGFLRGVEYMIVFGLGTVPMMLGIGFVGKKLLLMIRFRFQKLIPTALVVLGMLLILRGMSLGIPYLSPALSYAGGKAPACH